MLKIQRLTLPPTSTFHLPPFHHQSRSKLKVVFVTIPNLCGRAQPKVSKPCLPTPLPAATAPAPALYGNLTPVLPAVSNLPKRKATMACLLTTQHFHSMGY
jgi:hypothetical protein